MDLLTSKIVKINYRNKKYMSSKYDICYHIDKNAVCFFSDKKIFIKNIHKISKLLENKYTVSVFFLIYEINH